MLLEVAEGGVAGVLAALASSGVAASVVGATRADKAVACSVRGEPCLPLQPMAPLRDVWEATSFALEKLQCAPACVAEEQGGMKDRFAPAYSLTFAPSPTPPALLCRPPSAKPRVAVVRQEGTNGDREMTAALWGAGIDAWDVTMSDLAAGRAALSDFRGVVFPGGFSYADVLDSAKGWAGTIRFNPSLLAQFSAFYNRTDTFSLGVCNGCQLMALLGWVPFAPPGAPGAPPPHAQPRFIHNASGRFESRFSTVRVAEGPAVLLKGMAGSVLGVWVSHGEGRLHFPDPSLAAGAAVPLRYCNDAGEPTEAYPCNPNGSQGGAAGLCSSDGRHLAVMPHPERAVKAWQWPWMPQAWRASMPQEAPWARMFQNARAFLEGEQ